MRTLKYTWIAIVAVSLIGFSCGGDGLGVGMNNDKSAADGEGGSMARMTILGDYLYAVDDSDLKVFNISDPNNVTYLSSKNIGREIETIFGFKGHLYIGSGTAVYIYSIDDPANPVQLEVIQHMYSCDPVVANDTIALSTIRTSSECRSNSFFVNQLILMDVSTTSNIQEVKTYDLSFEPYGIGLEDTLFFMCKGDKGIDVFDVRELYNPATTHVEHHVIAHIDNIHAFDVIPFGNLLIVVGETGMELYDYSDINNIVKLSGVYPD